MGKSRLLAEAQERSPDRARFPAAHAVSYAEAIPYGPVRELLRTWLGLGVSDPEARVRPELQADSRLGIGDAETEPGPEQLAHRAVGDGLGIGNGMSGREPGAIRGAFLRLGEEARLAHRRLPGDE